MENNNNIDVHIVTEGDEQVYVLQPSRPPVQQYQPQVPIQPQPQKPSKGRKVGAAFLCLVPWAILQVVQTIVLVVVWFAYSYDTIIELAERGRIKDMSVLTESLAQSLGPIMLIYGIISAIGFGIFYMVKYVNFREVGKNLAGVGWKFWLAAFIAVIGAQTFAQGFVYLYQEIPILKKLTEYINQTSPVYDAMDKADLSLTFILGTVIFIPIAEELVFRGIAGGILRKAGHSARFILFFTALFFAIAHGNVAQIVYVLVLGLAEGYMYVHKKTIIPTILMHMLYNFLGTNSAIESVVSKLPVPAYCLLMCVGLAAVAGAFFLARSGVKKDIPVNAV